MNACIIILLLLMLYLMYGLCLVLRLGIKGKINIKYLNPIVILLWPILLVLYLIDKIRG